MPPATPVLTVTQLNRHVRSWLEHEMGMVNVEGELSNLTKPASGHYYFTLKDPGAQIRCVYFRNRQNDVDAKTLQNGQQVILKGILSLYEARGDYQLIVEELSNSGEGDLYRQFELLKIKLGALGLFENARKRPIPAFPLCIGVITSSSGAALHDIQTTLARRYPIASVVVYSSDVQGKQAAPQLIKAIELANSQHRCDVIILAGGGGSIEDLWAFNDELLAHTIAKSVIPIVSGVGHETDFTIADFVADHRAATPTAAAEAVTPNRVDLLNSLDTINRQLFNAMRRYISHQQLLLRHEIQKITSPKQLISSHWQSLDYLRNHLDHAMSQGMTRRREPLFTLITKLQKQNPTLKLGEAKLRLQQLEHTLFQLMNTNIHLLKQRVNIQLATLQAVSPLATLDRGYAIATFKGNVIHDSQDVGLGDLINIRLKKGRLTSQITKRE